MQMYKPNLEDFSHLDEKNMQKEGLNTISPHESKNEEKVLGKFLVELPEKVNRILK